MTSPHLTVDALLRELPQSASVLKAFGIDTCCGAHLPLGEACTRANVALADVLRALQAYESQGDQAPACGLR